MEQIKSILTDVIKNIQERQKQNSGGDIESAWIKSAGRKVAKHAKIHFFKNGTLYVHVEDSAWLYELNSKKNEIVKKIKKASRNKVKEIKLKIGGIYVE